MVTVERLVVTVERLVVTVERLVVTYGVRQPSGTADPLTYQVGPGVVFRNFPGEAMPVDPDDCAEEEYNFIYYPGQLCYCSLTSLACG